jgi:catechol 2,3-dioxygenase-like lactoylglutathione lyase family enzyme
VSRRRFYGILTLCDEEESMNPGTFSISLAVKDIAASLAFYRKLGFDVYDGDQSEGWLILKNGDANIGLFQGMFEKNLLTFNPKDVRSIQRTLEERGVTLIDKPDVSSEGPAYITMEDPDGNPIMFDQHDPAYKPDPKTID